jgi:hypothetical protein
MGTIQQQPLSHPFSLRKKMAEDRMKGGGNIFFDKK